MARRIARELGFLFALTASATGAAAAQDLKQSLMADFERQRANVLGMVQAMPEAGLRTAPTAGVRDFAQQIEHLVGGNVNILATGIDRPAPGLGDPEVYLNSKAELAAYVNRGFDAVQAILGEWTAQDLRGETSLFGQATVERWKLAQVTYEHAVWTLGATVPYLRLQGATPPDYDLIP